MEDTLSFISLSVNHGVATIQLARPAKSNAVHMPMLKEMVQVLDRLPHHTEDVRVVVLQGQGKNFCGGIDLQALSETVVGASSSCPGRQRYHLRDHILRLQATVSALERCPLPVIAAVQGACVGAGVDIITACDIRHCCSGASFCVKEVDLAITADMGTLQRLGHIVGHGMAADLSLTARPISGSEAQRMHLVSQCHADEREMNQAVEKLAAELAAKSPLAVVGTKRVLLHARDQPSVAAGLDYTATWNAAVLQSRDLEEAVQAKAMGRRPLYARL